MKNKIRLPKILAIIGTLLVWLPILAPVLFSAAELVRARLFRLDYLMPAELFPLVLVGAGLLLWAALLLHRRRGLIGWGLVSAVLLLVGSQGLAVLTGLASGRTQPVGWEWGLVLGALIAYILAVVVVGVGGLLLLRDLCKAENNN